MHRSPYTEKQLQLLLHSMSMESMKSMERERGGRGSWKKAMAERLIDAAAASTVSL